MRLILTLATVVAAVLAAPQGFNTQDAEFVPAVDTGDTSPPSPSFPGFIGGGDEDGGGFFPGGFDVHLVRIPQGEGPSIFDLLFGGGSTDVDETPQTDVGLPDFFFGPPSRGSPSGDGETTAEGGSSSSNFFPSFISSFFGGDSFPSFFNRPRIPDFPTFDLPDVGDLPNGYDNSTYEVKVVNGTQFEVNRTITKDQEGNVVFTQVLINVKPDGDEAEAEAEAEAGAGGAPESVPEVPAEIIGEPVLDPTLEEADPINNQVSSKPLVRRRRWLVKWLKSLGRPKVKANALPTSNVIPSSSDKEYPEEVAEGVIKPSDETPLVAASPPRRGKVISYVGDTDVNYAAPLPRIDPDAEVFDLGLVRENAEEYFNREARLLEESPLSESQQLRSVPERFQSLRSLPMRSQPMVSQTRHSQSDGSFEEFQEFL